VSAAAVSAALPAPQLSVVIPSFRGASTLPDLLRRLDVTCERLGTTHEIVVVDDASPDHSWTVLQALAASHPSLRAIRLATNCGQAAATMCGLALARGHLVATMDDDLQHPPEALGALLGALSSDPSLDAVVGAWSVDGRPARQVATRLKDLALRLALGAPGGTQHTALRLLRRPLVDAMLLTRAPGAGPTQLLWQQTRAIATVTVPHHPRTSGRSGYRGLTAARLLLQLPLRAAVPERRPAITAATVGIASTAAAVLLGCIRLMRCTTSRRGRALTMAGGGLSLVVELAAATVLSGHPRHTAVGRPEPVAVAKLP
jgi:polyisoprenyl-phosphate glycosyltransferase